MKKKLIVLFLCIIILFLVLGISYVIILEYLDSKGLIDHECPVVELSVDDYNAQIEVYFGERVMPGAVYSLINRVLTFNETNELYNNILIIFNDGDKTISLQGTEELSKFYKEINGRKKYHVEATAYDDDGFISEITIIQKDNKM